MDYVRSFVLVAMITFVGWFLKQFISPVNLVMLYLLGVVVIAFRRGLWPAIFTAVVSVIAFDFFLVPPYLTFRISDTEYLITFAGMIIIGGLISLLVTRSREHAESAQTREKETAALYALSQDLTVAADTDSIISAAAKHVNEIFRWDSAFLVPEDDRLVEHTTSSGLRLDADELAVATWAFEHGAVAGYDTDTLHSSRLRYIPLESSRRVLGIMGVRPAEPDGIITPEQAYILMAFSNLTAQALERVNLTKDNR
jgi:two-component system sensor histidine kinase KdpD